MTKMGSHLRGNKEGEGESPPSQSSPIKGKEEVRGEEERRWTPAFAGEREGEGEEKRGEKMDSGFRRNDGRGGICR